MAKKKKAKRSGAKHASPLARFIDLSEALTGFDRLELLGTGVAHEYYDELLRAAGEEHVGELLDAAASAVKSKVELRRDIWNNDRFGPMARSIVLMWYLGSWFPLPPSWLEQFRPGVYRAITEHVVSAEAYKEGLVWPAMGAHCPGAKPPGFGSWANKPRWGDPEQPRQRTTRRSK